MVMSISKELPAFIFRVCAVQDEWTTWTLRPPMMEVASSFNEILATIYQNQYSIIFQKT
jgi:hypothetical protein